MTRLLDHQPPLLAAIAEVVVAAAHVEVLPLGKLDEGALVGRRRVVQQVVHLVLVLNRLSCASSSLHTPGQIIK